MFEIKIPATSANLGPGFDSLGLALNISNKFIYKENPHFKINLIDQNGDFIHIPREENLIYTVFRTVFEMNNQDLPAVEISAEVNIPFARGMGSSATAILGGLIGANILLDNIYDKDNLLNLAIDIEGHPDNIVPAFTGGMVINILSNGQLKYKKVRVSEELKIIMIIPDFKLSTAKLRELLPEKIMFSDAIFNISRTALLTSIFYDSDWDLLKVAMEDRLHQDYRSKLIPGFDEVLKTGYDAGALGIALSGAGPTIITFALENEKKIAMKMADKFKKYDIDCTYIITKVDNDGTVINKI